LLNLREEGYGLAAGGIGIGVGALISTAALSLFPNL
jgi:hypothetical protein